MSDGGQTLRVLAFIKGEIEAGREFPRARQIADQMGWKNETGARDAVVRLKRWGHLVASSPRERAFHRRYALPGGAS